jgi:hypothetical protein
MLVTSKPFRDRHAQFFMEVVYEHLYICELTYPLSSAWNKQFSFASFKYLHQNFLYFMWCKRVGETHLSCLTLLWQCIKHYGRNVLCSVRSPVWPFWFPWFKNLRIVTSLN